MPEASWLLPDTLPLRLSRLRAGERSCTGDCVAADKKLRQLRPLLQLSWGLQGPAAACCCGPLPPSSPSASDASFPSSSCAAVACVVGLNSHCPAAAMLKLVLFLPDCVGNTQALALSS
jgi:hypothetical protein